MDEIDILPHFEGVLCHDHWKPYYCYEAPDHSLCNAHHLRELVRAYEQDKQAWADEMYSLLNTLNKAVNAAGGKLPDSEIEIWTIKYRSILAKGDIECPPPEPTDKNKEKTGTGRTE